MKGCKITFSIENYLVFEDGYLIEIEEDFRMKKSAKHYVMNFGSLYIVSVRIETYFEQRFN